MMRTSKLTDQWSNRRAKFLPSIRFNFLLLPFGRDKMARYFQSVFRNHYKNQVGNSLFKKYSLPFSNLNDQFFSLNWFKTNSEDARNFVWNHKRGDFHVPWKRQMMVIHWPWPVETAFPPPIVFFSANASSSQILSEKNYAERSSYSTWRG